MQLLYIHATIFPSQFASRSPEWLLWLDAISAVPEKVNTSPKKTQQTQTKQKPQTKPTPLKKSQVVLIPQQNTN